MARIRLLLVQATTVLFALFATVGAKAQTAVGDDWSDDFEGTECGWTLINGDRTNTWTWGTAVNNGGTHALYVSNDGGTSNSYSTSSSTMVYAAKLFSFTGGKYEFSYDWRAYGESSYDYLRVALVPAAETLSAGDAPSGFNSSSLPTGWTALDGGSKLNLVSTWQNKSVTIDNVAAGNYYMVFAWRNDGNDGSNPPAAIDNVSIALEKYPKPTGLACTLTPGNGTIATLNWTENGTATAWQISVLDGSSVETIFNAGTNPFQLTGLTPETAYTAKVRAVIGNETSNWSAPVSFTPTNAYTITVNDGTETNYQVPIYSNYAYRTTKSQFIIPATSLSTITYATLQKLTFYATVETASWGNAQWEVYVKETDATAFSSTTLDDWSSMEKVRSAATLSVSGNKMEVEFTEGYQYQGGNLMVGFLQTKTGSSKSLSWYGVSATKTALGGYDSYVYQHNFLPKVTIEYSPGTAPTCPTPTNLMTTEVTDSKATIGWTSTASAWNLRYKASGEEWTTIENLTAKTYTMEGLTPNTTYYVQVQAVDGEDKSPWTRSLAFTAPFGLPYKPAFASSLPDGWGHYYGLLADVQEGTATLSALTLSSEMYAWYISNSAYVYFSGSQTKTWLVTPAVALGQASNLSFDLWETGYYSSNAPSENGDDDKFVVLYSVDNGISWTQLALWDKTELDKLTSTATPFKFDFPAACAGKSVKVAFYAESTESNAKNRLYINNVVFDDAERCLEPTELTATNVTNRAASVCWTSEGDHFNLQYKAAGDADWTSVDGINATTYNLAGLTPKTVYTFRVQTVCSDTKQSIWSEEGTFTTQFGIPFTEAFATSSRPDGWTSYSTLMSGVLDGTTVLSDYTNNGAWGFTGSGTDYYAYVNLYTQYGKQWLVTPDIIMDVANCQLTFDLRLVDSDKTGVDDQFAVLVTDDGGTTWAQLALWNNSDAPRVFNNISYNGQQVALDLSAYYGKTIRLAFYAESTVNNADNVIRVDNVSVDTKPVTDAHCPQGLSVSNITRSGATITWDADAAVTSWNIQYGSRKATYRQTKTSDTNSYNLTPLSAGTEYEVLVQAVTADGKSSWSSTTFVTEFPTDRCNISYELKSKNEYGWNGTVMKVIDNSTGIEMASLTLAAGQTETNGTIELCNGRRYDFLWIPQDYYADCSYSFRDVNGDEFLYADAGKTGQKTKLAWYTMDCAIVDCHQPTNLQADEVGFYSVTASWTPGDEGQEKWEVICRTFYDTPSATTAGTEVTTASYTFNNLNTDYTYYIYVRGVKGDVKSRWSRCLQVRTKNAKALPTGLFAYNETFTTADVEWEVNGIETKWDLRYAVSGGYWTTVNGITLADGQESPTCQLTGLTPNTEYYVQVRAVYDNNSTGSWTESETFWTENDKAMPTDLTLDFYADNPLTTQTAKLTWEKNGAESKWNVRYRKAAYAEEVYFDDFEYGLGAWTVYTEGEAPQENGWYAFTANTQFEAHSGSKFASAWSWYNNTAYNADNWLITPQIDLQGSIKFWVLTNGGNPDHYEVLLSTTGNAIADFTVTLKAMATAPTTGEWEQVSIDLSAYTGQQGYVAIHHVSNDDNYLFIDDAGLYINEAPTGEWQTLEAPVTTTQCTLTGLTKGTEYEVQVQAVYDDESTGEWTESYVLQTIGVVPLIDDDRENEMTNSETIAALAELNEPVDIVLFGRTLYQGRWNTLCVPFGIDNPAAVFGAGVKVKTLSNYANDGATVTITYADAATIEAGKPYIVMLPDGAEDMENPVFTDVTIANTTATTDVTVGGATFKGTYTPVALTANDTKRLFLTNNALYYPSENVTVNAFRAYFALTEDVPTTSGAPNIVIDFGEGAATGIVNMEHGTLNMEPYSDAWYTLDGRKLQGKPEERGIYIYKGRKIVVR